MKLAHLRVIHPAQGLPGLHTDFTTNRQGITASFNGDMVDVRNAEGVTLCLVPLTNVASMTPAPAEKKSEAKKA